MSERFHWFRADDDVTTAYSDRFNVERFPTLLVINAQEECLDRWRTYMEPRRFRRRLDDALERAGLPRTFGANRRLEARRWGDRWSLHEYGELAGDITDGAEMPQGLAVHQDAVWAAVLDQGWKYLPAEQIWEIACGVPLGTVDITSDGTHLYALERGWPGGKPIHVIDPQTDETVRTIAAGRRVGLGHGSATGIAWLAGKLWVLEGTVGRLHRVDPKTGAIEFTAAMQARPCTGLAADGELLVVATPEEVVWVQPGTGLTMRTIPLSRGFRLQSLAMKDGVLHALEAPVEAYTKDHELTWPLPKTTRVLTLDTRRK
ncbi:MAG: YncE family protein [Planctomycetota bacterium]|jgi:hypothetical protein